jgi:hypothetical protein
MAVILEADDYGNLRADPERLERLVWWKARASMPFAQAWGELTAKLVRPYEVDGQQYAHINGWSKHQRIARRGKPRIPLPPSESDPQGVNFGIPMPLHAIDDTHASDDLPLHAKECTGADKDPQEHRSIGSSEHRNIGSLDRSPDGDDMQSEYRLRPAEPVGAKTTVRRKPETDPPLSGSSRETVDAWCDSWAIPRQDKDPEVSRFIDHHRAKGNRMRDWSAAWRTWLANNDRFGRPRAQSQSAPRPDPTPPYYRPIIVPKPAKG